MAQAVIEGGLRRMSCYIGGPSDVEADCVRAHERSGLGRRSFSFYFRYANWRQVRGSDYKSVLQHGYDAALHYGETRRVEFHQWEHQHERRA